MLRPSPPRRPIRSSRGRSGLAALSRLACTHAHETLIWASKDKRAHYTFNYDLINDPDPHQPALVCLAHPNRPEAREAPRIPPDPETPEARAPDTAGLIPGRRSCLRSVLCLGDHGGCCQGVGEVLRWSGAGEGVRRARLAPHKGRHARERTARDLRAAVERDPSRVSPLADVIADTHIPRRARALPESLLPHLARADLVLHAGDLMDPALLDELALYASVRAVRGNLDPPDLDLPENLVFEFGDIKVAMIHDFGRKQGHRTRLRRRFPDARVVVFGHSHIPFLEDGDGFMMLNPGSPTDRRRQPHHTFALLHAEEGKVRAEILPLQAG